MQDLRYALRSLLKSPGFTVTAVAVLAIGIGATGALFSAVDAVLLRSLPFEEPDRLLALWETNPERNWTQAQVAAANYVDWRERTTAFTDIAAYNDWLDNAALTGDGEPQVLLTNEVTGNFFQVLGLAPALGTFFDDADTWAGSDPGVVLAHAAWQQRFGGDPGVLGSQLTLDGVEHTIVGVAPAALSWSFEQVEAWLAVRWAPERRAQASFRRAHGMRAVGRMKEGVTVDEAVVDLQRIAAYLESEYPETNIDMGVGAGSLREWMVGDSRQPLLLLLSAVGFVLLIACANVANMQLVRSADRRHEVAVRRALGAANGRLLRQRLTESLLLTSLGGALGLVLAAGLLRVLVAARPAIGGSLFPRLAQASLDARMLAFTFLAVGVTGVFFAVIPTLAGTRNTVAVRLGSGTRSSVSRAHSRASTALVVLEVALVVPLVVGAGLMVRTLFAISAADPGFEPAGLTAVEVSFPRSRYPDNAAIGTFMAQALDGVRARPGVESAGFSARLPFVAQRWSSSFRVESWPPDRYGITVRHDEVSPGAFATMGVTISEGRDFERADATGDIVAMVNRSFVDQHMPEGGAVGERLCFDQVVENCRYWYRIVGVVENVRRLRLSEEERPSIYALALQDTPGGGQLLVRSQHPATEITGLVRSVLQEIDPAMPIQAVRKMDTVVNDSIARERLFLNLLGAFAATAVLLAALGIYGVVSYTTARRIPEIGVRVALGATPDLIARTVMARGLKPVALGATLGFAAALATSRLLANLLFGVVPLDPATYGLALLVLAAVASSACWVPARRALHVDPVDALRAD